MAKTLIDAQSISKSYGYNKVLDEVSFQINEGSFTTVLGLNGAGKSTLINVLSGRTTKDKSRGTILGIPFGEELAQKRGLIGYVSELLSSSNDFTLKEVAETYGAQFETWDQEYFDVLISERKIDLSKSFMSYSRGQKMQFFLCLALAQRPQILFVDEITSVLDYKARAFFLDELDKICQSGGAVVLSTNIVSEVHRDTTDLVILQDKRAIFAGSREALFGRFIKLCDTPTADVPAGRHLLGLGRSASGKMAYITEKQHLTDELSKFIDPDGPNLGEVFVYLSEFGNER